MKKLAIVTTHPIQYYAPLFRLLHSRQQIAIKVFYTWGQASMDKHDPGFGKQIAWDIPLLDGYEHEWMVNTAAEPGSHHFKGIVTPKLIDEINNFGVDAVLVFGWAYHSHLKVLRYFKGKLPVYFRGDSTLLDEYSGFRSLLRTVFLKWVYSHVDHAFYVGTSNKAYFKKYGLKERQLSFAPHAVDNDRFAEPRPSEATALRQQLQIPENALVILFAGKFEDKKSPDLLLKAFLTLNTPNTHLLLVGNGKLEQQLKQQASDKDNIHFMDLANQSYMPVVYQACDVFCLPSKGPGETWGLAVNEAMACGKVVIASDKCGCAADLVNRQNGLIFESESLPGLVTALKEITASKTYARRLGDASSTIIQSWSLEKAAEAIEEKLLDQ